MQIRTSLAAGAALAALVLSGCVTDPTTGQQRVSKTAMYGLGAAATCGIVGAVTHGSKGARNSALACGAIGAGVGGYMDYQEKLLRDKLANSQVEVARVGDQIKLVMPENITFATGSAALSPAAASSLTSVAEVLAKYTDTTITIAGHTDNTGSDAVNNPLSENRARSVADFLYGRGVASTRMRTVGYGSRQPVAANDTPEGRAKNRRVEILINPQVTQ